MHIAARNGLVAATQTLLEKGASVTMIDVNGYTPALACAPNAPVADCLSMIIHIMTDSLRNGRRSDSLNFSALNLGESIRLNKYIYCIGLNGNYIQKYFHLVFQVPEKRATQIIRDQCLTEKKTRTKKIPSRFEVQILNFTDDLDVKKKNEFRPQ